MTAPERLITHGTLLAGAVIVSFPFLWLVATSIKVPREMAAEGLRLLPLAPRPQSQSPYIDSRAFDPPAPLDGISADAWSHIRPRLDFHLETVLDRWSPKTPGPGDNPPPSIADRERYRAEMKEGLHHFLDQRISDRARAIGSTGGMDAILAEAQEVVNDQALQETFDLCYRRVCLGGLRLRSRNEVRAMTGVKKWAVESGPARLVPRIDSGTAAMELRADFSGTPRPIVVSYHDKLPMNPADVERLFVSFRGDNGWARISFQVIRTGRLYETRERINLQEWNWREAELRWPGISRDATARKPYLILHDQGPAPAGSPPFAVNIVITCNTTGGAWIDKVLRNYRLTFKEVPFLRYIMTSASLSILNILLAVLSCSLVAYAFARLEWPGRDLCFALLLSTMMIPPQVTMIPGFIIMKHLGWYNTLLPLWVPAAFGAPFFIFLMRQFLKNVPKDLEEAARMDGCGFLRIYWHVMLPLVKPTLATIAIFTFMGTWNNFMGPLIFVNDERLFPLALGLFKFNLTSGANVGLMMAGSFMMTLPIIILFFFVQRYFIQGVSLTGVKG